MNSCRRALLLLTFVLLAPHLIGLDAALGQTAPQVVHWICARCNGVLGQAGPMPNVETCPYCGAKLHGAEDIIEVAPGVAVPPRWTRSNFGVVIVNLLLMAAIAVVTYIIIYVKNEEEDNDVYSQATKKRPRKR